MSEDLLPVVYRELRRLAALRMANQPSGQTIQPTELVHEVWLKLNGHTETVWRGNRHFYFAAAQAMRQILIDRARKKQRLRHGGKERRVCLDDFDFPESPSMESDELLALMEALDALESTDQVKAQIVQLKFFIGLKETEIAEQMGCSIRTVKRHWAYSKAWLFDHIVENRDSGD